tara:strand:- start:14 stop:316 length:303 start_codon:yes stop_codon:yes gene_type:complete
MNVFKKIATLLKKEVRPKGDSSQTSEECYDSGCHSPRQILKSICNDAGIGDRILDQVQALEKFEAWYDGPCDEESVRSSLTEFKLAHPGVSAKLVSIGNL